MAATKLRIYQDVARLLGDARFAVITDDVDTRYALDDGWTEAVEFVLGQATWRFATKTAALIADSSAIAGFAIGYAYPVDWLRTHAIFLAQNNGRQCPIDLREEQTHILTNSAVVPAMRYVSSAFADPATAPWPEHFAQCVAAYLAFLVAERVTGDRGAPAKMSSLFASLLPEAVAIDAIDEDPWLMHQRDGSFLRVAREMADQAFWRFALATVPLTTVAGGAGGFSRQVAVPTNCSQTRSLYVLTTATAPTGAGERRPFKIREHGAVWYTDETSFYAEYVSITQAMDSTLWPEQYMRAVLRALHFDKATRADDKDMKDDLGVYKDALAAAIEGEAVAEDPWLEYQLSGAFDTGSRAVLSRGYWWWGIKTLDIDVSGQEIATAHTGFPYRYELPSDWLRTHALFVTFDGQECPINIRETNQDWSTDSSAWTARYLSTDVLDAKTWPEQVADAVRAYLDWRSEPAMPEKEAPQAVQLDGAEFQRLLGEALSVYSRPEDDWLRFQLSGQYRQATTVVIERGRWRFGIKTVDLAASSDPNAFSDGTVSSGYAYRMLKPNDWLRTIWLYRPISSGLGSERISCDYREEAGAYHADYAPLTLRYISRWALDATQWPSNFRAAVLLWCQYCEMAADAKMAAQAARKLEQFQLQCKEAETLDDERDVPRVLNSGRFVSARYGRSNYSREQGWRSW